MSRNWATQGVWCAIEPCPNRCVSAATHARALKPNELAEWIGEKILDGRGVEWRPDSPVKIVRCECAVVVQEAKEIDRES